MLPQLDDLSRPQLQTLVGYLHRKMLAGTSVQQVAALVGEAVPTPPAEITPARSEQPEEKTDQVGEDQSRDDGLEPG